MSYNVFKTKGWGICSAGLMVVVGSLLTACGGGKSQPVMYTINASVGNGGTIAPGSRDVQSGQTTSFTVTANAGYQIDNVTGCGGTLSGSTYTTGIITSACNVSASFKLNSYTVTAVAGVGGSISPLTTMVQHGTAATFDVIAAEGFGIETVSGCGGALNGNIYTTAAVTANCEVSASFIVTLVAPQNLQVAPGNAELTYRWDAVSAAASYNLYFDIESNIDPTNYAATGTGMLVQNVTPPYTLTELTNGTTYFAVVTAVNGAAESSASNEVSAKPEAPFVAIGGLNDTGIVRCANNTSNNLGCSVEGFSGQDAEYGRDARALAGTLTKIGNGDAGFDYTKIAADGSVLAVQNAAWLANGTEAEGTTWRCVRDNVTGLVWEVKTTDAGLHDRNNTYSWYNPDDNTNGGVAGTQNGGSCSGSACDTNAFVMAVNNAGLCGANNWRMPSRLELLGIIHHGKYRPAIDTDYFPNTPEAGWFWSSSVRAIDSNVVLSNRFQDGYATFTRKDIGSIYVRLVSSEQ